MARILVVEDYPVAQRLMRHQLGRGGHDVALASDGLAGLQALRAALEEDKPFQLAIVDVSMPGMDGLTMLEQLRQEPRLAGLAVIMLTASFLDEDRARAAAAGAFAFLGKPTASAELLATIEEALQAPNGHA
jgi:CheY-like chemotaxis protein